MEKTGKFNDYIPYLELGYFKFSFAETWIAMPFSFPWFTLQLLVDFHELLQIKMISDTRFNSGTNQHIESHASSWSNITGCTGFRKLNI